MIEIRDVEKKFGRHQALQGMNMIVPTGQVFGLIGPNGAGKSTTISILATLLMPDGGTAKVGGVDVTVSPREVRRLIGYMPDFFGVYDNLTAREYLQFYAGAYGIEPQRQEKLVKDLLALVNLSDKIDNQVDTLSRGMKQRLGLARCLVHDPQLLLLDEPASGLDPRARAEMKAILRQLRGMGKTILISSHILPELAQMCDVIGMMENGRMIASGDMAAIAAQTVGHRRITVQVLGDPAQLLRLLRADQRISDVEPQGAVFHFNFSGDEAEQVALLRDWVTQGIAVSTFGSQRDNIEDIFLSVMGEGSSHGV